MKNVRAARTVRRVAARTQAQAERRAADPGDPTPAAGIHVARLVGIGSDGVAMVALEAAAGLERVIAARLVGALDARALGGAVAVMFEGGRQDRPVVLGPISSRTAAGGASAALYPGRQLSIEIDARRLVLSAEQEVVLRCGPATITLTSDGRVAIRGAKILSRASGANKIKGGSVQIN